VGAPHDDLAGRIVLADAFDGSLGEIVPGGGGDVADFVEQFKRHFRMVVVAALDLEPEGDETRLQAGVVQK
jgi:hypothetical protein